MGQRGTNQYTKGAPQAHQRASPGIKGNLTGSQQGSKRTKRKTIGRHRKKYEEIRKMEKYFTSRYPHRII